MARIEELLIELAREITAAANAPGQDFQRVEEDLATALDRVRTLTNEVSEREAEAVFYGAIAARYRRALEEAARCIARGETSNATATIAAVTAWGTLEPEGIPRADIEWFERLRYAFSRLPVLDATEGADLDRVAGALTIHRKPWETDSGLRASIRRVMKDAGGE